LKGESRKVESGKGFSYLGLVRGMRYGYIKFGNYFLKKIGFKIIKGYFII
jgi:hypothetical protein